MKKQKGEEAMIELTRLVDNDNALDFGSWAEVVGPKIDRIHAVCVYGQYVKTIKSLLNVKVVTVSNFPHGSSKTEDVIKEVGVLFDNGADEVDFVYNYNDNTLPSKLVKLYGQRFKAILETPITPISNVHDACLVCVDSGVQFLKTSTGKNGKQTTIDHVTMLSSYGVGVKVSGGVKTKEQIADYISAFESVSGVKPTEKNFRIGTSSLVLV